MPIARPIRIQVGEKFLGCFASKLGWVDSKVKIQSSIISILENCLPLHQIYIGYSGGVDSHVLLDACALLPEFKSKITAVYIHHGLQKEADDWAIHCQKMAEKLGVLFLVQKVNATVNQGESPEESARNARYREFQNLIDDHDVLLIAQHREDQLETVLLQLFRGSGLKGLAGIPEKMPFGKGTLVRPLLPSATIAIEFDGNCSVKIICVLIFDSK